MKLGCQLLIMLTPHSPIKAFMLKKLYHSRAQLTTTMATKTNSCYFQENAFQSIDIKNDSMTMQDLIHDLMNRELRYRLKGNECLIANTEETVEGLMLITFLFLVILVYLAALLGSLLAL